MIRERGSARFYRASVAYHLVIVAVTAWLRAPVATLFAMMLARAYTFPKRQITPKQVGIIEPSRACFCSSRSRPADRPRRFSLTQMGTQGRSPPPTHPPRRHKHFRLRSRLG